MAPEVLAGAPSTTLSDVYSLGILLFQLSVGELRRPLTSDWERYIPDGLLREDIALATAADPAYRLPSVAEFARRLRGRESRLHAAEAAAAATERASADARALERARVRRPWVVAALATLAVGLLVSLTLYRREFAAGREAVRENQRTQAVNAFLGDILRSADPSEPRGSAKMPLQTLLRRADDRFQGQFGDDPQTKATVALTLAKSFFGLSDYVTALRLNQQAVSLRFSALGAADPATLESQYELARTLDMLSRHAEARRVLDSADRAAQPQFAGFPKLALLAYSARGGNELLQMQVAPALADFTKADEIRRRASPDDDELFIHLRSNIAWCDVRLGRNEEAVQALTPLLAAHYSPEVVGIAEWIKVRLDYSLALKNRAQFDLADQVLNDARQRATEVLGPTHYLVGLTWNYSSELYMAQAKWKLASAAARQAYDLWHSTITMENQATRSAHADIAVIGYLAERTPETFHALEAAREDLAKFAGNDSPLTQYVTFYWANALLDFGRAPEAAIQVGTLTVPSLAAVDPALDWEARLQGLVGRLRLAENRSDEARTLLRNSISTLSAHRAQPWLIDSLRADLRTAERASPASAAL
jgi:non-specific serine/threonine protein kinase